MRLDRYTRVADFLAAAGDFLAAREAEHNLILGISSALRRTPGSIDGPPYLAVVSRRRPGRDGGRCARRPTT